MQAQCLFSFRFRQIAVARTHRQAIGLPDDGMADNLDGKVEITDHPADYRQLLQVLFAEDGDMRHHEMKELGDNRRHPVEVAGPIGAAEALGDAAGRDPGLKLRLEHFFDGRGKERIDPFLFGHAAIPLKISRIGAEILPRPELDGIDEETDDSPAAQGARQPHQGQVAGMKPAHGRDEYDLLPFSTPTCRQGRNLCRGLNQLHSLAFKREIFSSTNCFPGSVAGFSARVARNPFRVSRALSTLPWVSWILAIPVCPMTW